MKKVTIIGVEHYSKGLYSKLIDAYCLINPDAICIEYDTPGRALRMYNESCLNKFRHLMTGERLSRSGQEVSSAINYAKFYKRTPIYCIDTFYPLGLKIIPLINALKNTLLSRQAIRTVTKLRNWGIARNLEKILKKHDNAILITGNTHAESVKNLISHEYNYSLQLLIMK